MHTDPLSIALFLTALRAARGWRVELILKDVLDVPRIYRPHARA